LLATALLALSTSTVSMPDNCKRDAALGLAPRGNCIGVNAHQEEEHQMNQHAGTQQPPTCPALAAQHHRQNTGFDSYIARPISSGVESDGQCLILLDFVGVSPLSAVKLVSKTMG
ncbi:hypothetical protein MMC18_005161, partial [Xylographa bjoerkii]|nr:hypothetical protein [Xylographa bjoerkii]